MASPIDYGAVDVPPDKPASEYTYAQRRSEILALIRKAGHPRLINQRRLSDRYNCTPQNINKDMKKLASYVDETLGDRRTLNTQTTVERAIEGLLDEAEWRKAAKTALEYDEWIRETKELDELEERIVHIEERREWAKYR
jgi:hypothetical protein